MLKPLPSSPDIPAHERYKFKPFPGSSHSWALQRLTHAIHGKRLLDIGAGSGGIGLALRDSGPAELVAVEVDTRSHESLAATYDRVVTDLAALRGEEFNWILALDVLEHLPNPREFLGQIEGLLAAGGTLLISVPNVAHWSVRFPLFFMGKFEYRPLGILDGTHLQFFTRRVFRQLCSDLPNCWVEEISASIEPFELALQEWVWNNSLYRALIPLRLLIAKCFPGLMAYQHLAVVRSIV